MFIDRIRKNVDELLHGLPEENGREVVVLMIDGSSIVGEVTCKSQDVVVRHFDPKTGTTLTSIVDPLSVMGVARRRID